MINITIYGLDQFVVGQISRELTPLIAKLYQTSEDDIVFIAPNSMVFHKGTEQTSWNILMKVDAPMRVAPMQSQLADLLMNGIGEVAIHVNVEFSYYSEEDVYQKVNENYPLFISDDNLVNFEDEYSEEMEEGEDEDQIFTGDIFEGLKDK